MLDEVLQKFIKQDKRDAASSVELAIDVLKEITTSGYIPFTSPAPSSTERKIRDSIRAAICNLGITLEQMKTLYGKASEENVDRRCIRINRFI